MKCSTDVIGFMLLSGILVAIPVTAAAAARDAGSIACNKPDLPDRRLQPVEVKNVLQLSQAYIDCIAKEIDVERSKASGMLEAAHLETEKSNKMVEDANTFIKNVKAFQSEHQGD